MVKAGAALARRRAIGESARRHLMLIIVMTKVLGGFVLCMSAIVGHRRPRDLERQQAQHKNHDKASHSQYYTHCVADMSIAVFRIILPAIHGTG